MIDFLFASAANVASPSPWNEVTITTAVVSAAALMIAGWSAWQSWLYHPRPELEVSWTVDDRGTPSKPRPRLDFQLVNRGKGEASDVRFEIRSPNRPPLQVQDGGPQTIGQNEGHELEISLVTGGLSAELSDETFEYVPPIGRAVPGKYAVGVRWRQPPRMNKVKHKLFSYAVKPEAFLKYSRVR